MPKKTQKPSSANVGLSAFTSVPCSFCRSGIVIVIVLTV
jgi:hypothetical protein